MMGEMLELRKLLQNRKISSNELEELRNQRLRTVIRHAYENVPYYRSLFSSIGLSPEDVRTVEDLKHIPTTTKDDLRAAGVKRITAKGVDLDSCVTIKTTGSTGKPFTVYQTRGERRTRQLLEFRGLLAIGFHPRDRLAVLGAYLPHRIRLHQRLGFYKSENISIFLPIDDQIRHLQRLRPTVLWAYPTPLRALLHKVNYCLSKLVHPRILITSAEVFDEVMRERIRADLDVEMFNFYGAHEAGRLAVECSTHEGLHVNADSVILECLYSNQPAERGVLGTVFITTLNAFTMPFIRYHLGDICTLMKSNCTCGSSFPLIDAPQGRENDMIRLPSGKILSPKGLRYILKRYDGIDQFRFIQERYDHLVLQLVLQQKPQEEVLMKMRSHFMEYLGEPVKLDIRSVDFIKEEKLKFREFISKLPKSDLFGPV